MKPLFIYGASHFGEEICQLFRDVNGANREWDKSCYAELRIARESPYWFGVL